ncbi:MAG TPA: hypothetical protein VFE62_20910 [Gemmataceae bacterium]|nr:hypothetical protein [Gemmataceae bacterium]
MRCLAPLIAVFPPLTEMQVKGYFALLFDLPAEAIYAAAMEVAASRVYQTWPTPGEIRGAAAKIMMPQITPAEAFKMARKAMLRMGDMTLDYCNGLPTHEWNEKVLAALPLPVRNTLSCFVSTIGPSTTAYAQFRDEYERQAEIARQPIMRPAQVTALLRTLKVFPDDHMPSFDEAVVRAQREAVEASRKRLK